MQGAIQVLGFYFTSAFCAMSLPLGCQGLSQHFTEADCQSIGTAKIFSVVMHFFSQK